MGSHQATICDGTMFFTTKDLSNAKPIPVEDCNNWVLGVALVQYSLGAGIKKFWGRGESGVSKELRQMHNMSVFCLVEKSSITKDKKTKAVALLMFLKEK